MNRTLLLAAPALACVGSSVRAGAGRIEGMPVTDGFAHGLAFGLLLFGALVVCLAARARLPVLGILVGALIAAVA